MNFAEDKQALETAPKDAPAPKTADKQEVTATTEPATSTETKQPETKKPYLVFETKDDVTDYIKNAVKNKEHEIEKVQLTAKELEAKLTSLLDERKYDKWLAAGLNPKQFEKYKNEIVLEKSKDNIAELRKAYDLNPAIVPDALKATKSTTGTEQASTEIEFINPFTGRSTKRR